MSASTHPAHPVTDNRAAAPATAATPGAPPCVKQTHLPLSPSSQEEGGRKERRPSLPLLPAGEERAGVRRGRPCASRSAARGACWRIAAAAALVCLLVAVSTSAFANRYEKGNWLCEDFSRAEQDYNSDPEDIYWQMIYSQCLITRGQGNDETRGMAILHSIVDNSTHPARVGAAWMIANYLSTGGTFEDRIDENNIDEAIRAYKRVIFFVDLDSDYPEDGNSFYEARAQIELVSHYRLPRLHFEKFKKGAKGTDNMHLLRAISYNGDRDLNTYPEYSPYTIDSLEKTIEFANQCINLPLKKHFQSFHYESHKAGCRVLKQTAQALLPLEHERLALLGTYSCSDDLPQCSEHYEIKDEIISIIKQSHRDLKEIFSKPKTQ